jgi:hypothetical protein
VDAEMVPELLHVGHEMAGGVVVQLAERHERPQPRWSNTTMR